MLVVEDGDGSNAMFRLSTDALLRGRSVAVRADHPGGGGGRRRASRRGAAAGMSTSNTSEDTHHYTPPPIRTNV